MTRAQPESHQEYQDASLDSLRQTTSLPSKQYERSERCLPHPTPQERSRHPLCFALLCRRNLLWCVKNHGRVPSIGPAVGRTPRREQWR